MKYYLTNRCNDSASFINTGSCPSFKVKSTAKFIKVFEVFKVEAI